MNNPEDRRTSIERRCRSAVAPRYLWIAPISALRWLWIPLAVHLQKITGLRPLLIVATEEDRDFYLKQPGSQLSPDQVVVRPSNLELVMTAPSFDEKSEHALTGWASEFERANDITMMRDMVQADRHIGRSYIVGWNNIGRSHASDRASLVNILYTLKQQAAFVEQLWEDRPPGLVIAIGTGIPGKFLSLICRRRDVPMRALGSGRFGDLFYWAEDEYGNSAGFARSISEYGGVSEDEIAAARNEITPTANSAVWHKIVRRWSNPLTAMSGASVAFARRIYSRLRGRKRALYGIKALAAAGQYFYIYRDWRYLSRSPFLQISDLPSNKKLVFYPLQKEPEASLQGMSPECSNQLALILEIGLSLPADSLLVVKEHPIQIGGRPREVYRRILQLPNAVMVRPTEPSFELIQKSALVCAINSSVAYEAAALGKPVAYFGRHGPVRAVPHVQQIDGYDDLVWLRKALESEPGAAAQRDRDGARFYFATKRFCMDLPQYSQRGRVSPPSVKDLSVMTDSLLASLPTGARKLLA